jgi:squalene-hopene/tetraprenyl-beta-curcumene cyclase
VLLRAFLGVLGPDVLRPSANWIRSKQREDGTWANFWNGPGDLSTTVEAYAALRLAGDPADAAHMRRAREWVLDRGGLERTRMFTRMWMALFGIWPWTDLPALPPEMLFAPRWFPLNPYDFGCWARQTIVPLTVVSALKPVRRLPFDLAEIRSGAPPLPRQGLRTWDGRFERVDDVLRAYDRRPNRRLRRAALRAATEWILQRQEADGSWGGIQPPWVWSIVMLAALGRGFEDDTLRRAVEGWGAFMVEDGDRLRPEACQSPVWDTGLAVIALRAAGLDPDHPQLRKAGEWLLAEEVTEKGDWAIRRPDLAPGGWAFEFENDLYPDVDDTAVVAIALRELGMGEDAVRRGLDWIEGMQSSNGGWGAFDADNSSYWLYKLPFCDFGYVIDPPSEDVSAHALEALAPEPGYADSTRRGLEYLVREQQWDGSWWGRWGVNHVYGTGAALPALEACGFEPGHPVIRKAVGWLDSVQQGNGGFGEDIRSYHETSMRGRGVTTASQTAWALLGYVAAGEAQSEPAMRAADFLCAEQEANGDWSEAHYTGTGFPTDFMIRYHLYRLHFPLMALGRLRERLNA